MWIVIPADWRSKWTLSIPLVDTSKPDLSRLFHIMYTAQLLSSSDRRNQNLSYKMQQTNGVRMVPVKTMHLQNPLWVPLLSRLQCSSYSQKRLICAIMSSALQPATQFRLLAASWREVQKWTQTHAFSLHVISGFWWISRLLSDQ